MSVMTKAERTLIRRAAAACRRIAREWDRETRLRIKGREGDNDDWAEACAKANAARECAHEIEQLGKGSVARKR